MEWVEHEINWHNCGFWGLKNLMWSVRSGGSHYNIVIGWMDGYEN